MNQGLKSVKIGDVSLVENFNGGAVLNQTNVTISGGRSRFEDDTSIIIPEPSRVLFALVLLNKYLTKEQLEDVEREVNRNKK